MGRRLSQNPERTNRAREMFLDELRKTCNVSHAARAAGVGRRTVYQWRDADPAFAEAWADAEEEAVDALELAARERAMDSSDRMMEILLKAHRPEKYVERVRSELTGANGGPITVKSVAHLNTAQLEALAAIDVPDPD